MRIPILLSLVFLSAGITSIDANTKRVPQDFVKIQLAINVSVNVDTILVAEGTDTK